MCAVSLLATWLSPEENPFEHISSGITMRVALLLLFFTGIICLFLNQLLAGKPAEVRYVYLPRTLDDALREEPNALVTLDSTFNGLNIDPATFTTKPTL